MYRILRVERAVFEFLKGIPPSMINFPLDVIPIIERHPRCKIHSYQSFAESHKLHIEDVISFCQSETGCTHMDNGNYIIMYNDSYRIPNERKTFTLAHELGHIVLKHFDLMIENKLAQGDLSCNVEREANCFAACILCPLPVVSKMEPKSAADIQRIFRLSAEASRIAWDDLQLYSRNHHISWHNDMIRLCLKNSTNVPLLRSGSQSIR